MTWRTTIVVELCQSMRETQDYTATPILADALEEVGYEDNVILNELRSPTLDTIDAQRLVAILYSDESATAVAGIEHIAGRLTDGAILELGEDYGDSKPMTYGRLMDAARRWVVEHDYTTEHGGENWRSDFPAMAEEFWELYEQVTGTVVKDRWSFFSCAC